MRVEGAGLLAEQFLLLAQRAFFFHHALELAVDEGFAFGKAPFGLVMIGAALGEGGFGLPAEVQGLFTGLGARFALKGVGLVSGAVEEGLLLDAAGGADIPLLAPKQPIAGEGTSQEGSHTQHSRVIQQIHLKTARGLLSDASAWVSGCNLVERHAAPVRTHVPPGNRTRRHT